MYPSWYAIRSEKLFARYFHIFCHLNITSHYFVNFIIKIKLFGSHTLRNLKLGTICSWVTLLHVPIFHDISYITAVTAAEYKPQFEATKNTIHLSHRMMYQWHMIKKTNPIKTRTTRTPAFWGYPPPPHDYPYHWVILDPKSKEDKVKVTNLKKSPKFQILNFKMGITRDTPSEVAW